jgi:hypothetical protein
VHAARWREPTLPQLSAEKIANATGVVRAPATPRSALAAATAAIAPAISAPPPGESWSAREVQSPWKNDVLSSAAVAKMISGVVRGPRTLSTDWPVRGMQLFASRHYNELVCACIVRIVFAAQRGNFSAWASLSSQRATTSAAAVRPMSQIG